MARVLHLHGIPVRVYKAEGSAQAHTQGGQLDIHAHNGQLALAAAGLTEQFKTIIHQGAPATRILEPLGAVLFEEPDDGRDLRPEVLRGELRQILLDSLPVELIQWGYKLASVESLGQGQHQLSFTNGEVIQTDLLVGADGAWSKVRPLLTEIKPEYIGTTFIETYLYDVDQCRPQAAQTVGSGAMYALTPGKVINVVTTYLLLI